MRSLSSHGLWHPLLLQLYRTRAAASQGQVESVRAYCDTSCDTAPTIVVAESEIYNVVGCTSTTTQLVAIVYFDRRPPSTASNIGGFLPNNPYTLACTAQPSLGRLILPFNSSSGSFSASALIPSKSLSNPQKSTSNLPQNNFKHRRDFQEHFYRLSFIFLTRARSTPTLSTLLSLL
jgi:hypothetical protein